MELREKARAAFKEAVGNRDDSLHLALETSVYNYTIRACKDKTSLNWDNPAFVKEYCTKARSISFNLKNPRNPELLQGLIRGDYTTRELVDMSHIQMFPAIWEEALAKSQKTVATEAPKEDGMFMCGKCKSYKTTYHQLQTRSADEPMTTFVTCLDCGKRWKF